MVASITIFVSFFLTLAAAVQVSIFAEPLFGAQQQASPLKLANLELPPYPYQSVTEQPIREQTVPVESSDEQSNDQGEDDTDSNKARVTFFEAPDVSSNELRGVRSFRVGVYDEATRSWTSSTSMTSANTFSKGIIPHFVVTVSDLDPTRVLGVACQGARIDAGATRNFSPQVWTVPVHQGVEPHVNKPVVLSPEGKKVEVEEKTFLQKYWWVIAVSVLLLASGGGGGDAPSQ